VKKQEDPGLNSRTAATADDQPAPDAHAADEPRTRAAYIPPTMTRLGTVTELTEKIGAIPDGGGGGSFGGI
jgi:hypothetical protein